LNAVYDDSRLRKLAALDIAKENQTAYIEALHAYRFSERSGKPTPFMIVHSLLAQHLDQLSNQIEKAGRINSTDCVSSASATPHILPDARSMASFYGISRSEQVSIWEIRDRVNTVRPRVCRD